MSLHTTQVKSLCLWRTWVNGQVFSSVYMNTSLNVQENIFSGDATRKCL